MKILKFFVSIFLFLSLTSQVEAQRGEMQPLPEDVDTYSPPPTYEPQIKMRCRKSTSTATVPPGNYCYVITVTLVDENDMEVGADKAEYLSANYYHCEKVSDTPVTSLNAVFCFGPDSCGPTIDTNTPDNYYHVDCGVYNSVYREGCDVIVGEYISGCGP